MDEDVARRRKIEEGRRRLERIKAKKDGDKPDVPLAKKPLPSPFAVAVRKPLPEFDSPQDLLRLPMGPVSEQKCLGGSWAPNPVASVSPMRPRWIADRNLV